MKSILMVSHHKLDDGSGDSARVIKIGSLLQDSIKVEYLGEKLPNLLFKLKIKLLTNKYDYVYCYNQRYVVMFINFIKCLFFKKYRIIYDTLLTWKLQGEPAIREIEENLAVGCADYIIAVSEMTKKYYEGRQPLLVPTLVNTRYYSLNQDKRLMFRKRYGFNENDKVIGLVGGFDNKYNRPSLDFLRDNINKLDSRIKLLVIGKTDILINNSRIVFSGYVQDYVGHLSALDALLVYRTIPTDGAINRIVEAMSMGIPVISNLTASKAMDYAIPNSDYYISDDSILCQTINEVAFKDNVKLAMNARITAESHYSENIYKNKLLEVLN